MEEKPRSTYETAALAMLSEGADRMDAGAVITLTSGARVEIVTGWAAWFPGTSRVVATGRTRLLATPRAL